MTGDARDKLIRVVRLGRMSALMMAAGTVLSEVALLALVDTAQRFETLMVGSVAVAVVSVVLLPLSIRLPGRLRRTYDTAVPVPSVDQPLAAQAAVRRLSLWRTAGFVGVTGCWLVFIGVVSDQVLPPVMLCVLAVTQWGRSRATARWERENGAVLWQGVPGLLRPGAPVFRVPLDAPDPAR
ncbi:hypothetical protein GFH48_34600 [Streptomyces fagopyri]|uniref:Uncharacterized protein n=1 Tax=Streptomyces fagopyri TaxID=2662397 RepID=A0A5Q0LKZ0_9ACTN|nr:hypothetical protein [Streptomyces fagopyri]QFZ77753.1 hypothetical protein GFH48_34600 [Streptomyces fagopyri]